LQEKVQDSFYAQTTLQEAP